MSGLDPMGRREVRDLMEELKQQGKTVFFSTHILSDAEALCDRVAVIHQGELRGVGQVAELTSSVAAKVELIWNGSAVPRWVQRAGRGVPRDWRDDPCGRARSAAGSSIGDPAERAPAADLADARAFLAGRVLPAESESGGQIGGGGEMTRIVHIAANTFREAVRDRVLYNLIAFALLLSGAAILVGQISIDIERLVVVNLGLTAVSLFGVVIAIFIGIGLVSKEMEKRTLYTVLSRPVRRWEFIVGKFLGLTGTLVVNTFCMAIGVFAALLYVSHKFQSSDAWILVALFFIVLQFLILCSLALLFSSFSSPLLSAVFAFSLFVIGSFAEDLRGFAGMSHGLTRWLATGAAYLVPNFSALNVIGQVAHEQPIAPHLIAYNTAYALAYSAMAICGAVLIFERRNLK